MRLDLRPILRTDHRADIRLRVQAGAKPQPARVFDDALDEARRDPLMHVDTLGGGADLARIEQRGPGDAGNGYLQVGVFGDDERVFAAELQVELLDLVGGNPGDMASGFEAAGEGDDTHARIEHQWLARLFPIAGDDIDDTRRQMVEHLS